MNTISVFVANYFIYIATTISILYVFFMHERRNHIKHIAVILGSAVLAWTVGHFLKDIIQHPRPNLAEALISPVDPYSFPSGHASFMFGLGFATYYFNKKTGSVLLFLALLTGVARVLVGVHFWYDIVGGAVLGYLVSFAIVKFFKKASTHYHH